MTGRTWILLGGVHSLGFAAFHLSFWKIFRWRESLQRCTPADRAILQILNLRLTYLFLLIAALCFLYTDELLLTELGKALLTGMSLFWVGRLIEQFIYLRINHALAHTLTALFAIGAVMFAMPLIGAA